MRAPLVHAVVWLGIGLTIGLHRPVPSGGGPMYILLAMAGIAAALALGRSRRAQRGLPLLFLLAGGLLGGSTRTAADRSCLRWIPDNAPVEVRAAVLRWVPPAEPEAGGRGAGSSRRPARPASGSLRLKVESVGVEGRWHVCGAELPARFAGQLPITAGQRVVGGGRWWSPPGARSLLGRPGTLLLDTVAVDTEGVDRPLHGSAAAIREAGVRRIEAVFPRHSALVASLLLAQRDALDRDVRDRYARAGLSHLLAISGLHVGLIAGILLLLAGALRIGKSRAPLVAALGTVAYVALLGAPDSAARAALQIVLVLAAAALQRPTRTESIIAAAAIVLLAADPGAIARPGFQLSFAGVAGILALRRPLLDRMGPMTRWRVGGRKLGRWLADGLATSLAATLATAPIVAWHFGRVAPVGIAANLLAIPLLGVAVPALALALLAGSIWLPAGRFLAGGAELLLDVLDRTATAAATVPFGTVAVLPLAAVVMAAAVAAGYALSRRLGQVRGWVRAGVWLGVACVVLMVAPLRLASDGVEIHLLDVGQGDAVALRSPGGRWLLVDAGLARQGFDAGAALVVPYLAGRGVRRLDALVITHPHADHMGGAAAVIRSLRPRWAGGPAAVVGAPQYLGLLRAAGAAGVPWLAVRRGMELDLDGMIVTILYPDRPGMRVEDPNDASVVMRVVYGKFSALLTGDAPASVEDLLVERMGSELEADLLKVGHHGSSTSTSARLLTATGARLAVISAGRGNRYGHPNRDVLARLRQEQIRVYRTDRHGTVVIRAGADGAVRIGTERESKE